MKIKVNDNVQVLTGKDKGKTGKVIKTLKAENKIIVEGINISKRHSKPRTNNDKGGIFDIEMPIHVSNVKLIKDNKPEKKETKKVEKVKKVDSEEKTAKKSTKKASK